MFISSSILRIVYNLWQNTIQIETYITEPIKIMSIEQCQVTTEVAFTVMRIRFDHLTNKAFCSLMRSLT
jgi:hypothetical protein